MLLGHRRRMAAKASVFYKEIKPAEHFGHSQIDADCRPNNMSIL